MVVVFGAIFAGLFMYFTQADLPTMLRNLDQFKPPKQHRQNKAHKRDPLITIIDQGDLAVGGLIQLIEDPERPEKAKIGAAICLGYLKAGKAAPPLAKLLGNPADNLNKFAAVALMKIGQQSKGAIATYLAADSTKAGRISAMYALSLFGSDARALQLIEQTLKKEQAWEVREAAILNLENVKGAVAARTIAVATQDSHEKVRFAAKHELSRRPPKVLVRAARQLIDHKNPAIRKLAVLLVSELRLADAYQVLKRGLMEDEQLEVACSAAPGFATWFKEYPQSRPPFIQRIKALLGQAQTRQQFVDLGQGAGNGNLTELVDYFLAWLDQGKTDQRLAACRALAETAPKINNGVIIQYLDDRDPDVAKAVHQCSLRLLARARKAQPALHYWVKPRDPPADQAWWLSWWSKQQKIYKLSDDSDDMVRKAKEKIRTMKTPEMRKAKKLLEDAREKLIELGDITGSEPTRRITNIQKEIATIIYHSSAR